MTLIDDIINRLDDGFTTTLDDELRNAGFLFEKAHRTGPNLSTSEQATLFGWTPEVISTDILPGDIERLRDAILVFIRRQPPASNLVSALWALSKLADDSTKSVLVETVEYVLYGDGAALFQAMIALDNLGEDIFGGRRSMSGYAVEENRKLAAAYLQRQGRSYQ